MTYKEIAEKYIDLFIMLVEKAGRETGNNSYLKVDEILKEKCGGMYEKIYQDEPEFNIFVCILIVNVFYDIYGDELSSWDSDTAGDKLTEFYTLYLKKATKKFCSSYGLPVFDDPETSFAMKKYVIKKN
ncbi:MAG: hypothetical protein J6I84_03255 [Bacilli bacterium]|nr:hypothetical protein [Bacilli bacterium]